MAPIQRPESLRFVFDDENVYCDRIKEDSWDTINKVKHVVWNHNGCNVQSLASSVTGIVFAICTKQKEHKTPLDCLTYCLIWAFKRRNSLYPNLVSTILVLYRGYNFYNELLSFIKSHGGNNLGTSNFLLKIFSLSIKQAEVTGKRWYLGEKKGGR